jgi:hypothetical protein
MSDHTLIENLEQEEEQVIIEYTLGSRINKDNIKSYVSFNRCINLRYFVIEKFIGTYEHKSYPLNWDTSPPSNIEKITII